MAEAVLGARVAQNNRIFLSLRSGRICETSQDPQEGFVPRKTKNKAGEVFEFYAKEYEDITAYITGIHWHSHEFEGGGVSQGWNLTLDVGDLQYVLQINSKERPFNRLMSTLANIDFSKPVRVVGFTGKDKRKVLLLYQEGEINPDTGRERPVPPAYMEKWLSQSLREKLQQGLDLTEEERRNIQYDADNKPDNTYPYITENRDGSWSFDNWTNFLMEIMEKEVIPACEANAPSEVVRSGAGLEGSPDSAWGEPEEEIVVSEDGGNDKIPF